MKNKIVYHLIYWVMKLKYRRRVINKQRAKVSGMCNILNSRYAAKGLTEKWRRHVGLQHGYRKPVETSGVYLALSKHLFSLLTWKHSHRHFSQHIDYSELENIRRIDIFNMLPRNKTDVTHREKNLVLFSKQSGLPSWRQASRYSSKNDFYPIKVKT